MILIVGLGNPGKKYRSTRHNAGFMAVGEFAEKNNFTGFKFSKKFNAETAGGSISGEKIILAKPQTFMNASGQAVKSLIRYYNIKTENLFVVHDDIDLPLGKIRISKNRGSAGHKGVQSIIDELRTNNFIRFRMGIGRKTRNTKYETKKREKFVLQKFNKNEQQILKKAVKTAVEAIGTAITENAAKAMNEFN